MNTKALRDISYGMYVITSIYDNEKVGCIVNTVTQVSSEGPTLLVNINKNNYTNQIIKKSNKLNISILSEKTSQEIITTFGYKSSKDTDKFENINYEMYNNLPIIKENMTSIIHCEVLNIIDANTHDIFILKVLDSEKVSNETPMTYKYYHEVMKGTSPKNAPTFIEETSSGNKYRCKICGYIYDDDIEKIKFEELPEDWVCPLCGAPKSMFEKI